MDELALHEPPRLGDPPVIDRQPIAGPQSETHQIEPAGFMHRALPPSRLVLDQGLPNAAAERSRPGVAVHARRRGKPLHQGLRLLAAAGAKDLPDRVKAFLPGGLIDKPFAFRRRLMGGNVGLRGGANIELQSPTPLPLDLAAPDVQRADLGEPGVQIDGHAFRLAFLPRPQDGADRRQRRHLVAIEGYQFARPIGEPRAGDIERELDRLGDQQVEAALAEVDVVARLDPGRDEAEGSGQ